MTRCLFTVLVPLIVAGCSGRDVPAPILTALDTAEQYMVLSLDPARPKEPPTDAFHGWRVLGRTTISEAATRTRLNAALRAGVRESDGAMAACFDPRHGIRVTRDGRITDLVICFECHQIAVYEGERKLEGLATTASPQATFDAVLRNAGVALPKAGE